MWPINEDISQATKRLFIANPTNCIMLLTNYKIERPIVSQEYALHKLPILNQWSLINIVFIFLHFLSFFSYLHYLFSDYLLLDYCNLTKPIRRRSNRGFFCQSGQLTGNFEVNLCLIISAILSSFHLLCLWLLQFSL